MNKKDTEIGVLNDVIESPKGHWEYFKDNTTGEVKLSLHDAPNLTISTWLANIKTDSRETNISGHNMEAIVQDLRGLFEEIDKYYDAKEEFEEERKFKLTRLPFVVPDEVIAIKQYYHPDGFRIRQSRSSDGTIAHHYNVKQKTETAGKFVEQEFVMSSIDYEERLKECCLEIRKMRYVYHRDDGLKWEVDTYLDRPGLVVAEIELPHIEHPFNIEPWMKEVIEEEVTGQDQYLNVMLAKPFGEFYIWWLTKADALNVYDLIEKHGFSRFMLDGIKSRGTEDRELWTTSKYGVDVDMSDTSAAGFEYANKAGGIVTCKHDVKDLLTMEKMPGLITDLCLNVPDLVKWKED